MGSVEKKEIKRVVEHEYVLTLNQEEMETLYLALASTSSYDVWDNQGQYGIQLDETVDTPYALYELVRDALDRQFFIRDGFVAGVSEITGM